MVIVHVQCFRVSCPFLRVAIESLAPSTEMYIESYCGDKWVMLVCKGLIHSLTCMCLFACVYVCVTVLCMVVECVQVSETKFQGILGLSGN